MNEKKVCLTVNGKPISVMVEPDMTLLRFLREVLKLTGTKEGCSQGECGSCTVLVNGKAVHSCMIPMASMEGCNVTTIEGLASGDKLDPLQEAFISEGAIQCGYCTPGTIMSAKALLLANPKPSEEEIKEALGGNLCRCTGYKKIVQAVQVASGQREPQTISGKTGGKVIGQKVKRHDSFAKAIGKTVYVDDLILEGMLYGKALRSPIAHGLIKGVDTSAALMVPGVKAVLTAKDIPGTNRFGTMYTDTPVLADDKVRCFGDAVALVVAENREAAERALKLIKVEYEELPGVFNPLEALAPEAPYVHENGNLLQHFKVRKGDIEEGFKQCAVVAEDTFTTSMLSHAYMEVECSVAAYDQGIMTVWTSTQDVYGDRRQIAAVLGLPLNQVRVVQMTTGGGFGGKIDVTTEILAALAAMKTGCPVKVRFTREESMMISPKRHPMILKVRLGANKEGKLLALEGEVFGDTGAYASLGAAVVRKCGLMLSGPYYIPNIKVDTYCVYTNNPPAGAFRGFGIVQAAFAHESLMDMLAESLGKDKWEFRYQNALEPGLSVATGQVLENSVGIKATLEAVKKYIEENPLPY